MAALLLHGAPAGLGPWLQTVTARGNRSRTSFAALCVLSVELARGGCRSTLLAQCAHRDRPFVLADMDLEPVADLQRLCRFHTCFVELHLPAFDCMRSEGPRLEEPRGPKPLVDP